MGAGGGELEVGTKFAVRCGRSGGRQEVGTVGIFIKVGWSWGGGGGERSEVNLL